jgi:hypothetical protein
MAKLRGDTPAEILRLFLEQTKNIYKPQIAQSDRLGDEEKTLPGFQALAMLHF